MSYGTVQAEKMTTESGYSLGAGNASSFKNRIINGDMRIDQRNAGASVTTATSGAYNLDRWNNNNNSGASRFTVQQNAGSVTPPAGFTNYLGCTSTGAYSIISTDVLLIRQSIEGYNTADLNWGTANAKSVVLSFWVYSSLTGTFGGSIKASGSNSFPFTYTINVANTWEQKTVAITGPTSGTWQTTTNTGIEINFSLGTGATYSGTANTWAYGSDYRSATGAGSVVGTNGATWYITGVQFEVGTVATSFDFRSYGTELALCQRYFQTYPAGYLLGNNRYPNASLSSGGLLPSWTLPVVMRTAPTAPVIACSFDTWNAGASTNYNLRWQTTVSTLTPSYNAVDNGAVNLASGNFGFTNNTTLTLSAEL